MRCENCAKNFIFETHSSHFFIDPILLLPSLQSLHCHYNIIIMAVFQFFLKHYFEFINFLYFFWFLFCNCLRQSLFPILFRRLVLNQTSLSFVILLFFNSQISFFLQFLIVYPSLLSKSLVIGFSIFHKTRSRLEMALNGIHSTTIRV